MDAQYTQGFGIRESTGHRRQLSHPRPGMGAETITLRVRQSFHVPPGATPVLSRLSNMLDVWMKQVHHRALREPHVCDQDVCRFGRSLFFRVSFGLRWREHPDRKSEPDPGDGPRHA
jgi:hypothetical protein